jgi:hypothetical protein
MSIMSVYGVDLPIAIDSLRITPSSVGMSPTRNANGYLVTDRRAIRHEYNFAIVARPLEEAMLYKELLSCAGDYWAMYGTKYSAKGLLITGTGTVSYSGITTTSGQTMIVPVPSPTQDLIVGFTALSGRSGNTIVGRRADGSTDRLFAWSWRGYETSVTNARERLLSGTYGPCQAYTGSETLSFGTSSRLLTSTETGTTATFSRLMWFPRFFGSDQLDSILNGWGLNPTYDTNYYPDPPRVVMLSDLFPSGLMAYGTYMNKIVAIADVTEMQVTPHWHGGAYDKTAVALSVKLTEV